MPSHIKKKLWQYKSSEVEEEEEGEELGRKVKGLPTQNDKPLRNIGEGGDGGNGAGAPLLSANLLHSSIYKHQLPQKSGCLLSINRNHSPMVHLIMRPHTEPKLDAAHHCLGQPASNPSSRPTPAPTLSPQTAGEPRAWRRKVHGARQQTLRLQQVCWTNEQRDAANQHGVRARFTHQQREISETSQRETTAQGPDSSSWHETFARIGLQSLYN